MPLPPLPSFSLPSFSRPFSSAPAADPSPLSPSSPSPSVRLVLDAMGGDYAPEETVAGAVQYARATGHTVFLAGDEARIRQELARYDTTGLELPIVHAPDAIHMDEKPAIAVRRKKDNAMVVGMRLVKAGEADAFCSVGNTGAVLTAGHMVFRRIRGVHRAVLTLPFPNLRGLHIFGDAGANADCRPEWLVQWTYMLSIYAQVLLEIPEPRVAFLANGEEAGKGNRVVQMAQALMARRNHIHYVGVVEPKEMMNGHADVVVTDGFTGNIAMKQSEAVANLIFKLLKQEIMARSRAKVGVALARPAFQATLARLDNREFGAALLLGLNGLVTLAHGRSKRDDIYHALKTTAFLVEADMLNRTRHEIERLLIIASQTQEEPV